MPRADAPGLELAQRHVRVDLGFERPLATPERDQHVDARLVPGGIEAQDVALDPARLEAVEVGEDAHFSGSRRGQWHRYCSKSA